jgi:hypothetical protein
MSRPSRQTPKEGKTTKNAVSDPVARFEQPALVCAETATDCERAVERPSSLGEVARARSRS